MPTTVESVFLEKVNQHLAAVARGEATADVGFTETERAAYSDTIALLERIERTTNTTITAIEAVSFGDFSTHLNPRGRSDQFSISFNRLIDNLREVVRQANVITLGDFSGDIAPHSPNDQLGTALRDMTGALRTNHERADWLKTGMNHLHETIRGNLELSDMARDITTFMTRYLDVPIGAFWVVDEQSGNLRLQGGCALAVDPADVCEVKLGEGLVGQAALEQEIQLVKDLPADYLRVCSGLGQAGTKNLVLVPFTYSDKLEGCLELASFREFTSSDLEFLETCRETIAIGIHATRAQIRNIELLEETQHKTSELEAATRYKSEFLANMSHELRTPLNSMLILAGLLAANRDGNLTAKQVEWARTIHSSGDDFLALLNEVLDLSKIEAGRMVINPGAYSVPECRQKLEAYFGTSAHDKGLDFTVHLDETLPDLIHTDPQRLDQILRNLLSNALKFTTSGSITVKIGRPAADVDLSQSGLDPEQTIRFSVTDTGLGIAADSQDKVFEEFVQAEGTTSRDYGGTGLGLPISRKFSELLGGELQLSSRLDHGSAFTLYLPEILPGYEVPATAPALQPNADAGSGSTTPAAITDPVDTPASPIDVQHADRQPALDQDQQAEVLNDRLLLVVEDDMRNAFALLSMFEEFPVRTHVAANGQEALSFLDRNEDTDLVVMDIRMPEMDGYEATRKIRAQERFADLPILALTGKAMPDDREKCLAAGATDYCAKPIDQQHLIELVCGLIDSVSPTGSKLPPA